MRIAVIGAGRVGQSLAGAFIRAGHEVVLSASSVESAQEKAQRIGASAAPSNREAVERSEIVVLAVWFAQHQAVAADIAEVARGKVVIDVSEPVTPDMSGLATDDGPSAAERLAERLAGAKVVKAFNTVFATVQAQPELHGLAADTFVAADDPEAKQTVMRLAASIGLRPIDAGPLRYARYLEVLGCLDIFLNIANGWPRPWTTVWKLVGAPVDEPR